jgi:hypothetical protein
MEKRFSIWDLRSLYRAGSLTTGAKELSKYKLDLVAPNQQENTHFTMGNGTSIIN